MRRLPLLLAFLPSLAVAQRPVTGIVYDSLLHAPLGGADVWLRATARHVETDASGRFHFDSVAPGQYTLFVSHPGLDSAGLFTLAVPLTVDGDSRLPLVRVATPSLATVWRRRCSQELKSGVDSGLVFGVVEDVQTHAHLAGAGVLLQWMQLVKTGRRDVQMQDRDLTVRTDSTGTYYACGVAADMAIELRAYAEHDSSGLIDLLLGPRGIGRQDLRVALAPAREPAVLRGRVMTDENIPVTVGRVAVREGASTVINSDGSFTIRGVSPGTQWVTVRSIGRTPSQQAVDLRSGDSVWLPVTLGPLVVTLPPVVVTTWQARQLADLEDRRRHGLGYFRNEAEIANAYSLRAVLGTIPSVTVRGRGAFGFMVQLPAFGIAADGTPLAWCVPALFIDGVWTQGDWDELPHYKPKDVVGVEVYPRESTVPLQFQSHTGGCGAVLIWTKYLQ